MTYGAKPTPAGILTIHYTSIRLTVAKIIESLFRIPRKFKSSNAFESVFLCSLYNSNTSTFFSKRTLEHSSYHLHDREPPHSSRHIDISQKTLLRPSPYHPRPLLLRLTHLFLPRKRPKPYRHPAPPATTIVTALPVHLRSVPLPGVDTGPCWTYSR